MSNIDFYAQQICWLFLIVIPAATVLLLVALSRWSDIYAWAFYFAILYSLDQNPELWLHHFDRARFAWFSDQERTLLNKAYEQKLVAQESLALVEWGDYGFAGNNYFTYLAKAPGGNLQEFSRREGEFPHALRAVYVFENSTNPHFQIAARCISEIRSMGRLNYYIVTADC